MKLFFLRQFVQNMQIKNKIHLITCQLLFDLGVLFFFFCLKNLDIHVLELPQYYLQVF